MIPRMLAPAPAAQPNLPPPKDAVETADDLLRRYPKLAELEGLEDEECIAAYSSVLVQLQRDLDSVRG